MKSLAARLLSFALFLAVGQAAFADGTETLGPPSIGIASGTDLIAAGVGLASQPGDINFSVPAGASVEQVLLYWEGQDRVDDDGGDNSIVVNGNSVTGTKIGGPVFWLDNGISTTFRADITGLGLVSPGANILTVSGLDDFTNFANGAGVYVIIDEGTAPSVIQVRDGNDLAFKGWPEPKKTTIPQTFTFAQAAADRDAELSLMVSAVSGTNSSGGNFRPSAIDVTVGGVTTTYDNMLDSNDGQEWDTIIIPVTIPAGATELTVQVLSEDNLGISGSEGVGNPASLTWSGAGLSIQPLEIPGRVSLGDRVWEDIDRDGEQDCADTNGSGIIGDIVDNIADEGTECGEGIPGVPVDLFFGDCETPQGQFTETNSDGFYLFSDLEPGDYCVKFGPPPAGFCDTELDDGVTYPLGSAVFTTQNAAGEAVDSDVNSNGVSGPVTIPSGQNLNVDAGVFCPAKIGDFVWIDDNMNGTDDLTDGDGIQDPEEPGAENIKTTLFACVDGVPTESIDEMRWTDQDGMYMYGAEPGYDLPPGEYAVMFDLPAGFSFTQLKADDKPALDSNCMPNGMTACVDLSKSRSIDLNTDCGITMPPPPACELLLDKQCRVEVPVSAPSGEKCSGKLQQFSVVWDGAGAITAVGPNNSQTVSPGETATFKGPFSNNDVIVNITGAVQGQSTFHVSCSDENFNDPSDCGKMAGNGKSDDSGLINDWLLAGFIDGDGQVLNCSPNSSDEGFADNCTFEPQPLPNCENGPKPETLTWRYDGGTGGDGNCADSTFASIVDEDGKGHDDFVCTGDTVASQQMTAVDDDGMSYLVNFGDTFTTPRDAIGEISLTAGGNEQHLEFHTSCSQPLEVGATAGALTLVALDDRDGAVDVTYRYTVTNGENPLSGVSIVDDPLGTIASGFSLGSNEEKSFTTVAQIFGTTMNTASASGKLSDGSVCAPSTATDSVTVKEAEVPPCSVGIVLYKVDDDKIKFKLTNNDSSRTVTLSSVIVEFPEARGDVEEIKLDGTAYKQDDSSNPVLGTPAEFDADDWTEEKVSKRQIKAGDTETLEIKTTEKSSKNGTFTLSLQFEEGCSIDVVVENQQLASDF